MVNKKNCLSVPVCVVEGKGLAEVQSLSVLMLPTLIALLVMRIWNYVEVITNETPPPPLLSTHSAVVPGSLEAERVFEVGLVDGAGYGRVVVVVVGNIEQPHVSLVLWPVIEHNFSRFYQL